MTFLMHKLRLVAGALALVWVGSAFHDGGARAQENLDQGKSGAQLFASDCAICHKTTAGLSKSRALGLDSFLREHYTASRESAAIIAAYIAATDKGPPPAAPARTKKKDAGKGDDKTKGDDKAKGPDKKLVLPGDSKPSDAKPADAKPADAKSSETKSFDAKPAEAKPSAAKPAEVKPSEGQPADIYKPEKKSD
jgi:hypothetical protein